VLFTTGNIYLAGCFNVGDGTSDGSEGAAYNVIDGQVEMCYFEDGYYDFVNTLATWNQEGLFTSDFVSLFGAGVADAFVLADDTGLWYGAQDTIGSAYAATYSGASDHFESVPMALVTQEAGQTIDTGTMLGTSGEAWSVTTACTQPEIAVAYLNWFFTDEGTEVCNYGIEGESFNYDETGAAVYTDLIVNNPSGLSQMQAQWLYCNFQAPYIQDSARNDSLYTDESQKEALSIWDSNRTNDRKYYGDMTTDESEQYNLYASDLNTYAGEMILKFILNETELNEASWNDFLTTLEGMHADDMVTIKQAAYDRYLTK
jgi:putative aldouronate transport system substrate-binding protein